MATEFPVESIAKASGSRLSHLELVLPLEHANAAGAQHEAALLDCRGGGHPCQGLPRPARQHDNAWRETTYRKTERQRANIFTCHRCTK